MAHLPAAVATVRQLQAVLAEKGIWAAIVRGLPAMAEALLRDGDPAGAAELVDTATTQLRGLDTPLAPAAIQHARGLLATTSGHGLPAVRHLLDAAASYERLRCPYEAAQAREQAGVLQLVAGDPAGAASLRAAYTIYQRLGASWDLDRAAHTARRYGVSMPARHRRGRRGYGTQLSPREREVAELVSAGRTNEEIAAELFLSVSTVEKHVKAVLRKSGATTRWQIRHRLAGTGVAVPAP